MRSKKAFYNFITSFSLQLVSIICGLIVPRLIITQYGSSINGMISSISNILGYVALLEAGIAAVSRASLYKPLADNQTDEISSIIKATQNFYRVIAIIYLVYLIGNAFIYPLFLKKDFDYFYVLTIVIIIGSSTFIQYFYGKTNRILLTADQKLYIPNSFQLVTVVLNAISAVLLIKLGATIHIVKIFSGLIFVVQPIGLYIYVKKKYKINNRALPNKEALKQRWDSLAQHIAFFLRSNSAILILTVFANIKEVSVYSVYYMVTMSVENLTKTFSTGLEATFGDMIAKKETVILNKSFNLYENLSFIITTTLFTITGILIIPFVAVYTKGVHDVNYIRPYLAVFMVLASAIYCIRNPYNSIVVAAGHFKQTKISAIIEAVLNIVLSVILINILGIVGVAISITIAFLYRTLFFVYYLSKNILQRKMRLFFKRFFINIASVLAIICIVMIIPTFKIDSFITWVIYAIEISAITIIIVFLFNTVFYKKEMRECIAMIKRVVKIKR